MYSRANGYECIICAPHCSDIIALINIKKKLDFSSNFKFDLS